MLSLINSLASECSCGSTKQLEQLKKLDEEIATKGFSVLKSMFFDLKSNVSQEDMFTLIQKRNELICSMNTVCKNSILKFHIGVAIPLTPCVYN